MARYIRISMLGALMVSIVAGAIWAQVPPPSSPGTDRPAAEATPPTIGMVEGTVKSVDPSARTVSVASGLFGIFRTTLVLAPDTQISVAGRNSDPSEIREGTKVKASYETLNGRKVATRIEVTPREQTSSRRST